MFLQTVTNNGLKYYYLQQICPKKRDLKYLWNIKLTGVCFFLALSVNVSLPLPLANVEADEPGYFGGLLGSGSTPAPRSNKASN